MESQGEGVEDGRAAQKGERHNPTYCETVVRHFVGAWCEKVEAEECQVGNAEGEQPHQYCSLGTVCLVKSVSAA